MDGSLLGKLTAVERLQDELDGKEYVRITFEKSAGRGSSSITEAMSLVDDARSLRRALLNGGADVLGVDQAELQKLVLAAVPDSAGTLFRYTGWKRDGTDTVFVLGSTVLGLASDKDHVDPWAETYTASAAGDLDTWKKEVAEPAVQSRIVASALMFALAAPLMKFSDIPEGVILNLAGPSSGGKSTANKIAASIYGNPKPLPGFDLSDAAISDGSAMCCDICRVLDDTDRNRKLSPDQRVRELYEKVDVLTAGVTKVYSRAVAHEFPKFDVRNITLTSSQYSVEDFCAKNGLDRNNGNRVRLFEMRVPDGNVGGIWSDVQFPFFGVPTSAKLTAKVTSSAEANYGVVGREFIAYLVKSQETLADSVTAYSEVFFKSLGPLSAEAGRIAAKVALGYAALRLAKDASVLHVKKKRAREVATFAFGEIIATAFQLNPEIENALLALQQIVTGGRIPDKARTTDVRRKEVGEGFSVLSENRLYLQGHVIAKLAGSTESNKLVLAHLRAKRALLPGHSRKTAQTVRLAGDRQARLLAFDHALLLRTISQRSHLEKT
jgi:hypothetical protein